MKRAPITITQDSKAALFRDYVEILQPLLRLRNREADILAQLLYYNNEKRSIAEVDRFELIFSTPYRRKIKEALKIKDSTLQNSFSILRKKGVITNNTIPKKFQVFFDSELELTFKFKLEDGKNN